MTGFLRAPSTEVISSVDDASKKKIKINNLENI